MKNHEIFAYDFDGVVSLGIRPRFSDDVIITGRCQEEAPYVFEKLAEMGISTNVYFNQMTLQERGNHTVEARIFSGRHKARTIHNLKEEGIDVVRFFDDDEVQIAVIKQWHPNLDIVHVVSTLVEK
jgi:hypothetical protein